MQHIVSLFIEDFALGISNYFEQVTIDIARPQQHGIGHRCWLRREGCEALIGNHQIEVRNSGVTKKK
jgi:hypothetical protein